MTASTVRLSVDEVQVDIDVADGARVISWRIGELDLTGSFDEASTGHGSFVMAPWAGRIRGNVVRHNGVEHELPATFGEWAIHGTVLDRPAEIVSASGDRLETVASLGADWPWRGSVRHSWQLTADSLTAQVSVESESATFPAEVGWHPWFRRRLARGEQLQVTLDAQYMLERGADHLPTGIHVAPDGVGPFDDAFYAPGGMATLTWPGALRLDVVSDCQWIVLFDELDDWVCVEPQTAPPDGLSDGFVVSPGRPRTASTTWRWSASGDWPQG